MLRFISQRMCQVAILAALWLHTYQASAGDVPFLDEYAANEAKLLEQYFHNIRTKVTAVGFNTTKRDGDRTKRITFTTITDGKSSRSEFASHNLLENKKSEGGVMWYGSEAYAVDKQPNAAAPYKLSEHNSPAASTARIDGLLAHSYIFTPLSSDGHLPLSSRFKVMMKQAERGAYPFAVESVNRVRHNGYDAVRVVTSGNNPPVRTTTYLDAGNHMAFREYETDGLIDMPNTSKVLPIKTTGVLTYAPSPEGFPVPKAYKEWFIHPDGRKVPKVEVTWDEFTRYTPTADDFDLEKQFGIKRLPPPTASGLPSTPGRSWWWLYAVAAALALVTAGLVVVARRRAARS